MEKALQTPAREQVQQDADRATFERRAVAVERERAISENELQSQIELARREEQLVAQRGANARLQAAEAAAASRIEAEAQAGREELLAEARARGACAMGEAAAAAEAARVAAYRDLSEARAPGPPRDRGPGGVLPAAAPALDPRPRGEPGRADGGRDGRQRAIPVEWRRGSVERADLPRFLFAPDDIVVAVGQDGLVADVAKYLDGQLVIGVNDDPARNPGVLVQHPPSAMASLILRAGFGLLTSWIEERTMVESVADDGQRLVALNEVYVGQPTHQTARYTC